MEETNLVPLYYSVSRNLIQTHYAFIQHLLQITPIIAAIIIDAHDGETALQFNHTVIFTPTVIDAHELAKQLCEPSIIISTDIGLHAHYADGHTQQII